MRLPTILQSLLGFCLCLFLSQNYAFAKKSAANTSTSIPPLGNYPVVNASDFHWGLWGQGDHLMPFHYTTFISSNYSVGCQLELGQSAKIPHLSESTTEHSNLIEYWYYPIHYPVGTILDTPKGVFMLDFPQAASFTKDASKSPHHTYYLRQERRWGESRFSNFTFDHISPNSSLRNELMHHLQLTYNELGSRSGFTEDDIMSFQNGDIQSSSLRSFYSVIVDENTGKPVSIINMYDGTNDPVYHAPELSSVPYEALGDNDSLIPPEKKYPHLVLPERERDGDQAIVLYLSRMAKSKDLPFLAEKILLNRMANLISRHLASYSNRLYDLALVTGIYDDTLAGGVYFMATEQGKRQYEIFFEAEVFKTPQELNPGVDLEELAPKDRLYLLRMDLKKFLRRFGGLDFVKEPGTGARRKK